MPDLRALHALVARAAAFAEGCSAVEARGTAVLVPSRSAAEALRRTIENLALSDGSPAVVLPDLVTRAELYQHLQQGLVAAPRRLTEFEREVIFRRAAADAAARGAPAPFRLRAGLVVEILALYDELRRRDRTVEAFERLMIAALEPSADIDRGAERLLRLTRFLAAAFALFEDRVRDTGGLDEHGLRQHLLAASPSATHPAYRRIIVTVPDQAADPNGLWLADFDLLARLPGLERLDIVATENVLAAGFHERVHDVLPGIEEERAGIESPSPVLMTAIGEGDAETIPWTVCRDREEELADVARAIKQADDVVADRSAVVFQRPLPYLYLARQVFPDAEIPYQALDALPLAAEPFAAALDLVLSFIGTEATRGTLVDLLRSPHWIFGEPRPLEPRDVAAADALLREVKYVGGWNSLGALAEEAARRPAGGASSWRRAAPALAAAAQAAAELRVFADAPHASGQLAALTSFIAAHERLPRAADDWRSRHLRARAAVLAALESLAAAHRLHDDAPVPMAELAGTIRRWIESQTFSPRTGARGLVLLDAPAAAYADVDDLRLVGLVDSDWPDRSRRSIFYPAALLTQLGWPADADRVAAARARFQDLLRLPRRRVAISLFTLEDDAIVPASSFLEEVEGAGLLSVPLAAHDGGRVFLHEALSEEPVAATAVAGEPLEWLAMRASRSPAEGAMFHGGTGVREPVAYAVSRVERYLECPFKYFAAHVLRLPEERAEESGLTPQERGQLVHEVFEAFFAEWQAQGKGGITMASFDKALEMFETVAEARIAALPEADRAIERTHLLGSAAASGLAERAFTFEVEQGGDVLERLLEHQLEGAFVFATAAGPRTVTLRAKADRIDLMADGTLRLIDYKLGKAPKASRALQLPVYGVCAEQSLAGRHGRAWTLGQAGYVAFREKNAFVPLGASSSLKEAVAAGQERFLGAIDAIERGEFPPDPEEPFLCTRCGYASVCRKDYVGDE